MLLGASGVLPGYLESMRAHFAGLFANLCLPSLVGGDLVRAGLTFDIDTSNRSDLDSVLRLFDDGGNEIAFSDDDAAPAEDPQTDSYIDHIFAGAGRYYVDAWLRRA